MVIEYRALSVGISLNESSKICTSVEHAKSLGGQTKRIVGKLVQMSADEVW